TRRAETSLAIAPLDRSSAGSAPRRITEDRHDRIGGDLLDEHRPGFDLLGSENGRGHGATYLRLHPVTNRKYLIRIRRTDHHQVDVLRGRPLYSMCPGSKGAVDEGDVDPFDLLQFRGEKRRRPGNHEQDLPQRTDQRAVLVAADQACPADL